MKILSHLKSKKLMVRGAIIIVLVSAFLNAHMSVWASGPGQAGAPYTVLAPLPCIAGGAVTCTSSLPAQVNFQTYVQYIVNLAIALSAVIAVFMIVWGGFEYITSTIPGTKNDGVKKIKNAVFGLILVLASYLILRTIDPRLVQIPDTFVPAIQLKTTLTQSATQSLMDNLQSAVNNYGVQNQKIISDLTTSRQTLTNLQNQEDSLNNTIDPSGLMSSSDIDALCGDALYGSGSTDTTLTSACTQRQQTINQESQTSANITSETAQGVTNALIQQCAGSIGNNTSTVQNCQAQIAAQAVQYASQLNNSGQYAEAQQVRNYALYGQVIAQINADIQDKMSTSPYTTALINSVQQVITDTGTVTAGPVGYAGAQALNGVVVNGLVNSSNQKAAQATIADINSYLNGPIAQAITDQNIKDQLNAQAQAYIRNLTPTSKK